MFSIPDDDQKEEDEEEKREVTTTICLFIINLVIYIMAMVVAETVPVIFNNPFIFIMVKYVCGTLHHSLIPLVIIITRRDLRDLIKVFLLL